MACPDITCCFFSTVRSPVLACENSLLCYNFMLYCLAKCILLYSTQFMTILCKPALLKNIISNWISNLFVQQLATIITINLKGMGNLINKFMTRVNCQLMQFNLYAAIYVQTWCMNYFMCLFMFEMWHFAIETQHF